MGMPGAVSGREKLERERLDEWRSILILSSSELK